jgi:aminoglycoside phosphotransferase (APT) family kinase protein
VTSSAGKDSGTLLDVATGPEYLLRRGIIEREPQICVALGGGVSNIVLRIDDLVLKQSLGRLRVADVWEAPIGRIVTEAKALRFAHEILPDVVPRPVDSDPEAHTLTMPAAPANWRSWKELLLGGTVDPGIASRLGGALAALHNASTADLDWLDQPAAFVALRVDPYHYAVADRLPDVAGEVRAVAEEMAGRRLCFVHGDYSPKNILVGDGTLWIIDFEVAHLGDPTFDVAFMLHHLLLKAVHRPAGYQEYQRCGAQFLSAYAGSRFAELASGTYLVRHVACLLLARAIGKSPAEYLDDAARKRVIAIGSRALREKPSTMEWIWDRVKTSD